MVIIESMISHRVFADQIHGEDPAHFDELTLGLGKAAAIIIFAYFFLKVLDLAHGNKAELNAPRQSRGAFNSALYPAATERFVHGNCEGNQAGDRGQE